MTVEPLIMLSKSKTAPGIKRAEKDYRNYITLK